MALLLTCHTVEIFTVHVHRPTRALTHQNSLCSYHQNNSMGSSVSLEQFPLQSQMHRPIVMTSNAFISSSIEALRVKLTMSSAFSGIRNVKDLQGNLKFLHISTGRSRNLGRVYDIADARGQVIYSVEPAEMTTFKKDFVHGDIDLATSHGYIS